MFISFLAVVLLAAFIAVLLGQSQKPGNKEIRNGYAELARRNTQSAITLFRSGMEIIANNPSKSKFEIAEEYYNIASVLIQNGEMIHAKEFITRAVCLCDSSEFVDPQIENTCRATLVTTLIHEGLFEEALMNASIVLNRQTPSEARDHETLASSEYTAGIILRNLQRYEEAIKLFSSSAKHTQKQGIQIDEMTVSSKVQIGLCLLSQNKLEESKLHFFELSNEWHKIPSFNAANKTLTLLSLAIIACKSEACIQSMDWLIKAKALPTSDQFPLIPLVECLIMTKVIPTTIGSAPGIISSLHLDEILDQQWLMELFQLFHQYYSESIGGDLAIEFCDAFQLAATSLPPGHLFERRIKKELIPEFQSLIPETNTVRSLN